MSVRVAPAEGEGEGGGAAPGGLARRLAGPALWSVLGAGASRVLAVAAAVAVARALGAAPFGEYNLVQATAGMLMALGGFGLNTTATKFLAGRHRTDPVAAGRVVALSQALTVLAGAVTAALLAALAPWVAGVLLEAPQLAPALRLAAPLLVLGPLAGTQVGILMGLERFRLIAVVSAASGLASVPLLAGGARLWGMSGAVGGVVAAAAVTAALQGAAVRAALREAGIRPALRGGVAQAAPLLAYAVPLTLSNLLLAPVSWATSALVARGPDGLRELGLFAAANQWRNAIALLATSAGAVVLPLFSRLHDSGRAATFAAALRRSVGATAAGALAAAAILAPLSPALMHLYGRDFHGSGRILAVLVVAGAVSAPLTIVGHAVAGAGRTWLGLGLNLLWASALLAGTWALRAQGAMGLSLAHLGAVSVHLAASLLAARLSVRPAAPPASASAAAAPAPAPAPLRAD